MPKVAIHKSPEDLGVLALVLAIIRDDAAEVARLLGRAPSLARESLDVGATRQGTTDFFFKQINHYIYAGDTPLHAAAAGYRKDLANTLIQNGAEVSARNRRGAEPLHYAADGGPACPGWDPAAQAEMIACLIEKGADPNALEKSGVAPLHRAVRQRCSRAVDSLLRHGATVRLKNKSGSTPLHLAVQNTGRGGTGSPEAKALQREIIELLLQAGADPQEDDGQGKTARQCAQSEWIRALL
jgi:ankyrin repeat protein